MAKRGSKSSKASKSSKVLGWNEFKILRAIVALAIVVYIVGIVPTYTQAVSDLFHEPVVKIIFLALVLAVGYLDPMLGVLLAIAFLVSLLSSASFRSSPVGRIVSGTQSDAQRVVRGVQQGVGAVSSGAQQGVDNVYSGARQGVQTLYSGAKEGVHKVVELPQHLFGKESMGNQDMNAQRAFESSQEPFGSDNCNVVSPPGTGCDPVVGYNAPYDCVCDGNCGGECEKNNQGCLCKGVGTWEDELNAQGLNKPMGYAGPQEGASY